jgi:hypothetical protein
MSPPFCERTFAPEPPVVTAAVPLLDDCCLAARPGSLVVLLVLVYACVSRSFGLRKRARPGRPLSDCIYIYISKSLPTGKPAWNYQRLIATIVPTF